MFEECFAMIGLNAFADMPMDIGHEPELSFAELTAVLVTALEEALFDGTDQRKMSIH